MNRKKLIYILLFILLVQGCQNKEEYEQWAINNYGQSICGKTGKENIDISLPENESIILSEENYLIGVIDSIIEYNGWVNNLVINPIEGLAGEINEHGYNILGLISSFENDSGYISTLENAKIYYIPIDEEEMDATYVIEKLQEAESLGIKIINCSFVFKEYNAELYNYIKNSNMLYVCAAGNNGEEELLYPAAYDCENVISVVGCNNNGYCSSFSNYSTEADIAAPGEDILCATSEQEKYAYCSGSSLATAFVTAACAYIDSETDLSAIEIKEALLDSCIQLDSLQGKVADGRFLSFEKITENIK